MLQEIASLAKDAPGVFAAITAAAGAIGAILSAGLSGLLGKLVVTPFLGARDKQDREVEWRKHAIELTKLDLERKLKSGRDFTENPLRPSILDFLANYRDMQELGVKTPGELYKLIVEKRTKAPLIDTKRQAARQEPESSEDTEG
jgi:hypothetical protein